LVPPIQGCVQIGTALTLFPSAAGLASGPSKAIIICIQRRKVERDPCRWKRRPVCELPRSWTCRRLFPPFDCGRWEMLSRMQYRFAGKKVAGPLVLFGGLAPPESGLFRDPRGHWGSGGPAFKAGWGALAEALAALGRPDTSLQSSGRTRFWSIKV